MAKVLYTAEATVTGGREQGHGKTTDGALEVDLGTPTEIGGGGGGTNPEQLFAIGYANATRGNIEVRLTANGQPVGRPGPSGGED